MRKVFFKRKILIFSFFLISLFLILNLTNFSKEVRNFFYLISEPLQKSLWKAGNKVSDFFATFTQLKNLKKEREELELQNQELLTKITLLEELKKENEFLREALGLGLEKEFKLEIAEIIGRDISQEVLIINKGERDNLSQGLPVITQQKVLVGKISQVFPDFAKVMLISHKEISFDGKILEKEIYGLIKGKGNLKLLFDFVPREKEIKNGDLIVTTPLGGVFPPGLLVGEVSQVIKSDLGPFQKAEIQPKFNLGNLEKLFIIRQW